MEGIYDNERGVQDRGLGWTIIYQCDDESRIRDE